jgi:predicted nucleic acid-binding protein
MPFVVDASVVLGWYFEDEVSEYADRVFEQLTEDSRALVPSIWPLEVANGLLVAERRGRLSSAKVARTAELTSQLPVSIHDVGPELAFGPVLDLARAHRMTAYDAAYLELAMREGLPLATQDEALRAAAQRVGVPLLD